MGELSFKQTTGGQSRQISAQEIGNATMWPQKVTLSPNTTMWPQKVTLYLNATRPIIKPEKGEKYIWRICTKNKQKKRTNIAKKNPGSLFTALMWP